MPEVIDSHVHLYPAEVSADPAGWAADRGEPGWLACVAPPGRKSIQGWADPERLIADMDHAGIEKCLLLGWYWERQETCSWHNAWYAQLVQRYPSRISAFASVQPRAGKPCLDALQRSFDSGLCGVGEILPQAQGFSHDDPVWHSVVQIALERGLPLTLHVTDPAAGPAAGPKTPLEAYLTLARQYPRATFILAHWGGGLAFSAAGPVPGNVFFDTAASPLMYSPEVFLRAVACVGSERILYGSDYPLLLYPRQSREPDFSRFLAEIRASGLAESDLRRILGENIRGLLQKQRASA